MANIMKMMKQMADMQKNLGKVQEALAAQEMETHVLARYLSGRACHKSDCW